MMIRMKEMVLGAGLLIMLASCGGLKKGVSYIGKSCGDDLMTLDGDTFQIRYEVGADLLIIREYDNEDDHEYLVRKAENGYYYVEMDAEDISSVGETDAFVGVNERNVYDIEQKKLLPLPCQTTGLYYLGQWKDLHAFCNGDTICFTDGKFLALAENTFCRLETKDKSIRLESGARSMLISLEELHGAEQPREKIVGNIENLKRSYYLQTEHVCEYDAEEIGFTLDMEVPRGESRADVAIRKWMLEAVKEDVFSVLGYQDLLSTAEEPSLEKMLTSLDSYGDLWEKLYRSDYITDVDSLYFPLNGQIHTRMIADTPDYVTYYYWATIYNGGIHDLPRSYYITYNKRRQTMLTAANMIRTERKGMFIHEVQNELKRMNEDTNDTELSMEEYIAYIRNFQMMNSVDYGDDVDDILKHFLVHDYECDVWSGWTAKEGDEISSDNIPLPHLALLPEGVVVSYHPYQIDCFAAGEYHAVLPYSKVASCLLFDYTELPNLFPKLEDFLLSR